MTQPSLREMLENEAKRMYVPFWAQGEDLNAGGRAGFLACLELLMPVVESAELLTAKWESLGAQTTTSYLILNDALAELRARLEGSKID